MIFGAALVRQACYFNVKTKRDATATHVMRQADYRVGRDLPFP